MLITKYLHHQYILILALFQGELFYTKVNVNGFNEGKFIFQEKATKELIENHLFREGPILEINEKYHWNTLTGIPFQEDEIFLLTEKLQI